VHLGAEQEQHRLRIDQYLDALVLHDLVGWFDIVGVFDGIGLTGAAAVLDADAQPDDLGIGALGELGDPGCRSFSELHHLRTGSFRFGWRCRCHIIHLFSPCGTSIPVETRHSPGMRGSSPRMTKPHHIFSTRRASSVMRSGVHAGSHTILTLTWPTPGTLATAFSTICGISAADGQFGVVSVISTSTVRSSLMSTL